MVSSMGISPAYQLHAWTLMLGIMIYNDKHIDMNINKCVSNIPYQMISSGFLLWDSNRTPIQQCSIFHDHQV